LGQLKRFCSQPVPHRIWLRQAIINWLIRLDISREERGLSPDHPGSPWGAALLMVCAKSKTAIAPQLITAPLADNFFGNELRQTAAGRIDTGWSCI
jgi:hypothetical protein